MKKLIIFSLLFCFAIAEDEFFEPTTSLGGYGELHYDMKKTDDFDNEIIISCTTGIDLNKATNVLSNESVRTEWVNHGKEECEKFLLHNKGDPKSRKAKFYLCQ